MVSFTINKCKVYVMASHSPACDMPVAGYPGAGKGLPLKFKRFNKHSNGLQALYSISNFFFRPKWGNTLYTS
jgi:hypothetical protein